MDAGIIVKTFLSVFGAHIKKIKINSFDIEVQTTKETIKMNKAELTKELKERLGEKVLIE